MSDTAPLFSLRWRLTIAMTAGFLLIIAALAAGLWLYARDAADRTYDLLLDGSSIAILERVAPTPEEIVVDLPPSALEILGLARDDRVFYRIFDANGRTVTGLGEGLPLPDKFSRNDLPIFFDAMFDGELVRFVIAGRTLVGPAGPRWVGVQVGQTRLARETAQLDLFWRGMIGVAVLASVGIAFALIGVNLAMRPLIGLGAEIERRNPTDLAPLATQPPREIKALIAAINGFMRRLETSTTNAQTFIADVTHQIRTSLAALLGLLDFAEQQAEPADMRERLRKASQQARRTIHLTNQLLSHAMVIHRSDTVAGEETDLSTIARGILEEILRDERTQAIDFEVRLDEISRPTRVNADPVSVREALRNLLDNAVAHADRPAVIRLSLADRALGRQRAIAFVVEDNGPGIPPDQRERVRERFVSLGERGSGLGLAIVQAVATSHKGALILTESGLGGLKAELILPCKDDRA